MTQNKQPQKKQHLVLMRPGFEQTLKDEFQSRFDLVGELACRAGVAFQDSVKLPEVSATVFARQILPRAFRFQGADELVMEQIIGRLDVMIRRDNRKSGSWTLHAFAIDDDDGLARATKISKKVMVYLRDKQKEFMTRYVSVDTFVAEPRTPQDIVIQIYIPAQDDAWFSIGTLAEGLSPWEGGFRRMKSLHGAPSRSASKLEEALTSLGKHPKPGDTAVDLGAAPGGWSFVLARHGAIVSAIDHAELDTKSFAKLKGQINHIKDNGLTYLPNKTIDWLVCDMVMGAKDTLHVLDAWHRNRAMKNFVVNVKLPKNNPWPQVADALQLISGFGWETVMARHLIHDRSEITLMGSEGSV